MAAPYHDLRAWRECHSLALQIYRVTKTFPVDERYGLTSQIRRASFSGAVNIVEGSARKSKRDFRRFLDIALASLTEVGYTLEFAYEAGMISKETFATLEKQQSRARFLTWRLFQSLG